MVKLLVLVFAAAVVTAPVAHAYPPNEVQFLTDLNAEGFTISDSDGAISSGYAICTMLDTADGPSVAEKLYVNDTDGMFNSPERAFTVVQAVVNNLCPEQAQWH